MFKRLGLLGLGAVFAVAVFAGCSQTPFEKYGRNISEVRDNVFAGEADGLRIEVVSGRREDPFVIDGTAGETVPFTVVTIAPSERRPTFSYRVEMNGAQFSGNFLPHPYLDTFSADIAAATQDRQIRVTVTSGDFERTVELTSIVTDQMLGAEAVFEIAMARLTNSLSAFYTRGRLNAEIYIRLVSNPITQADTFYWYVAFVTVCGQTFAALIDPVSGEILAVRE